MATLPTRFEALTDKHGIVYSVAERLNASKACPMKPEKFESAFLSLRPRRRWGRAIHEDTNGTQYEKPRTSTTVLYPEDAERAAIERVSTDMWWSNLRLYETQFRAKMYGRGTCFTLVLGKRHASSRSYRLVVFVEASGDVVYKIFETSDERNRPHNVKFTADVPTQNIPAKTAPERAMYDVALERIKCLVQNMRTSRESNVACTTFETLLSDEMQLAYEYVGTGSLATVQELIVLSGDAHVSQVKRIAYTYMVLDSNPGNWVPVGCEQMLASYSITNLTVDHERHWLVVPVSEPVPEAWRGYSTLHAIYQDVHANDVELCDFWTALKLRVARMMHDVDHMPHTEPGLDAILAQYSWPTAILGIQDHYALQLEDDEMPVPEVAYRICAGYSQRVSLVASIVLLCRSAQAIVASTKFRAIFDADGSSKCVVPVPCLGATAFVELALIARGAVVMVKSGETPINRGTTSRLTIQNVDQVPIQVGEGMVYFEHASAKVGDDVDAEKLDTHVHAKRGRAVRSLIGDTDDNVQELQTSTAEAIRKCTTDSVFASTCATYSIYFALEGKESYVPLVVETSKV